MAEVMVWVERIDRIDRIAESARVGRMYCTLVKPADSWVGDLKLAVSSTFTEVWLSAL